MRPCPVLFYLPLLTAPISAYAAHYLTAPQAQRIIFPEALRFEVLETTFDKAELHRIATSAGSKLRPEQLLAWRAIGKEGPLGVVLVYEVIGKHEYITFAVGFSNSGSLRSMEILDYREAHGDAVCTKEWRAQFERKNIDVPLELGSTIKNVSGATLSAKHLTEGVNLLSQVVRNKKWLLP